MRVLLKDGQQSYEEWVLGLRENPNAAVPLNLLEEESSSYEIPGSSPLESRQFQTKFELAKSLMPIVNELRTLRVDYESWPNIWDSLALFYFQSICPVDSEGSWNPNRVEHYVYDRTHTKSRDLCYRHRIYGPTTLYRTCPDSIEPFFKVAPCVLGQYEESIGSVNELAGNKRVLQLTKALYLKEDGSGLVIGYTSTRKYKGFKKKLDAPGGVRRIPAICKQLRRTYDLAGISYSGLLELLPHEFDDWLMT